MACPALLTDWFTDTPGAMSVMPDGLSVWQTTTLTTFRRRLLSNESQVETFNDTLAPGYFTVDGSGAVWYPISTFSPDGVIARRRTAAGSTSDIDTHLGDGTSMIPLYSPHDDTIYGVVQDFGGDSTLLTVSPSGFGSVLHTVVGEDVTTMAVTDEAVWMLTVDNLIRYDLSTTTVTSIGPPGGASSLTRVMANPAGGVAIRTAGPTDSFLVDESMTVTSWACRNSFSAHFQPGPLHGTTFHDGSGTLFYDEDSGQLYTWRRGGWTVGRVAWGSRGGWH